MLFSADLQLLLPQLELAKKVKKGCEEEGLVGLTFNTIGISDAITMGTQGMRYS